LRLARRSDGCEGDQHCCVDHLRRASRASAGYRAAIFKSEGDQTRSRTTMITFATRVRTFVRVPTLRPWQSPRRRLRDAVRSELNIGPLGCASSSPCNAVPIWLVAPSAASTPGEAVLVGTGVGRNQMTGPVIAFRLVVTRRTMKKGCSPERGQRSWRRRSSNRDTRPPRRLSERRFPA